MIYVKFQNTKKGSYGWAFAQYHSAFLKLKEMVSKESLENLTIIFK